MPPQDPFNQYEGAPGGTPQPVLQQQYQPYFDTDAEQNARYAAGGMAPETYASESNFSDYS
jgi:hypothetical protein